MAWAIMPAAVIPGGRHDRGQGDVEGVGPRLPKPAGRVWTK
jgi:hypothetical protein